MSYQQQVTENTGMKMPQPFILKEDEKMPLFLIKLWNIVEDPAYYDVIRWDESGYSFHILDPYSFCRNVLPQYFKHNNLNSLIRQLNMYGFRKMTPIERSSLARAESDQDHLEFSHPYFVRDHPELLVNIKRKAPTTRSHPENSSVQIPTKDLSAVLEELRQLRDRQKHMENKIQDLVKENELIWQEMHHMRGTHVKQQQIVNKLVQFLVALVQPQKRLGKRHLLAIDEIQSKKIRTDASGSSRGGPSHTLQTVQNNNINEVNRNLNEVLDQLISQFTSQSNANNLNLTDGPIIADVTDELDQLSNVANQPTELALNMNIPPVQATFPSNHPKYSTDNSQAPLYVIQNPKNQRPQQNQGQLQVGRVQQYPPTQQIQYQPQITQAGQQQQLMPNTPQSLQQQSPQQRISPPQPYEAISSLPQQQPQQIHLGTTAAPVQQISQPGLTHDYMPINDPSIVASPPLGFSPSDFNDYLSNMDQGIENCRELIGGHWDNLDIDGFLDYDGSSPEDSLHQPLAIPTGPIINQADNSPVQIQQSRK
uniref:HSF-type DNA-binding domain-containing protein n=1 Tax=Acrobeloides nanus TaxID=290746 RepID=A0A914CBY9_9BILA